GGVLDRHLEGTAGIAALLADLAREAMHRGVGRHGDRVVLALVGAAPHRTAVASDGRHAAGLIGELGRLLPPRLRALGELRVLDEAALSGLSGAEIHRHVGLAALHGRVLSAVAGHSLVLAALLLGVAHRLVSFSVAGLASRGGSHLLKWAARVSALGNGRFVGTVR